MEPDHARKRNTGIWPAQTGEPPPVLCTHHRLNRLHAGDVLMITTTGRGTPHDFCSYCEHGGNSMLPVMAEEDMYSFLFRKRGHRPS